MEVLAMSKQVRCKTFSMALSCADLRQNDLAEIISKVSRLGLSAEDIESFLKRTILKGATC